MSGDKCKRCKVFLPLVNGYCIHCFQVELWKNLDQTIALIKAEWAEVRRLRRKLQQQRNINRNNDAYLVYSKNEP